MTDIIKTSASAIESFDDSSAFDSFERHHAVTEEGGK